jgi:hypothetical protein
MDMETTHETKTYTVLVDDNFHFMDENERYELGTFPTLKEALDASMKLVGADLLQGNTSAGSEDLVKCYEGMGEDPFIVGVPFSAWDYARDLAAVLGSMPAACRAEAEEQFRNSWQTGYLACFNSRDRL